MKDIVIIGSGGLAKEIKYLIDAINRVNPTWNFLGFADSWGKEKGTEIIEGYTVIGRVEDIKPINNEIYAVIAIGFPNYIKKAYELISDNKLQFPNLIHPTVEMSARVIGKGNIISYGGFISCDVEIGDFNFFNTHTAVGHDAKIGSFNVFNPRTQISGSVTIGNENFWGLNTSIIQGKSVGNRNKIGGGSMMMKSAKDDEFYFGTPARKQENI